MQTMQAGRLYGIGDLRVESVPVPVPREDEALLAVEMAGICGSDLHNYRTGRWFGHLPAIPGHELVGRIVDCGTNVRYFKPGDRVVADSRVGCGRCDRCNEGLSNLCPSLGFVGEVCGGGFAPYVALPERLLHAVPTSLSAEVAVLAEPLAVAVHAADRLNPPAGEAVLILGGGPIGGLIAAVLAHRGLGPLFLVERNPERAARICAATGAQLVSLADAGIAAAAGPGDLRYAVDATGNAEAVASLPPMLNAGGRLVLVGIFHDKIELDLNLAVERELEIVGCSAFGHEMPAAIDLLPDLAAKLAGFVDPPIGLDELPLAYARLLRGSVAGLKVIVRP